MADRPATLATLIKRAEKARARANAAEQSAYLASSDMEAEARRIAWAALLQRGIARGDLIGFSDPKRARWHDRAPRLDMVAVWRGRDMTGKPEWRIKLRLTTFNARGKPHRTPKIERFEVQHPRDIARQVVKVIA